MNNPEQIYENIFNSIIDGVLLVSPSMTVQKSNLTVEDMFHRSSDSVIILPHLNKLNIVPHECQRRNNVTY